MTAQAVNERVCLMMMVQLQFPRGPGIPSHATAGVHMLTPTALG
jgi:hypothetical protein